MAAIFVDQETRMQDAKMTSTFQLKDELNRKRYQKMYTSSAVGRGGKFSSPIPVIVDEPHTKEVVFKRAVDEALAKEDLDALHQAWAQWRSRTAEDVPLDNRELAKVLDKAASIAQGQVEHAMLRGNPDAVEEALQALEEVEKLRKNSGLTDSRIYVQEAKMQDTRMTSSFPLKEQVDRKRYQKMYTSSAVGRGGKFSSPIPVIVDEPHTKEVVFKRAVDEALAEESLEGLHQAWAQWRSRTAEDVPLDNQELAKLRRQAVDIARRQLGEAIRDGSSAAIQEALRNADEVADVFPGAPQMRSMLEYKAARNRGE